MLPTWLVDRPPGQLKDIAAGLGSLATVLALTVGALWAWRKYKRTAESRLKVTLRLALETSPSGRLLLARASIVNDGGRACFLRRSKMHRDRPATFERLDPFSDFDETSDEADVSRITVYPVAGATEVPIGFINWLEVIPTRAELGCFHYRLRPQDTWANDVVFRLPPETSTILVVARVWVRSRGRHRFLDAYRVEIVRRSLSEGRIVTRAHSARPAGASAATTSDTAAAVVSVIAGG